MKESAYNGLNMRYGPFHGSCVFCGGMRKQCYRWRELGGWLYKVLPCHSCSSSLYKNDPDCSIYLERTETWVDLPLEEQRKRLEREHEAVRSSQRTIMARVATRLPQQTGEPPTDGVNEDVEDVQ